MALHHCIVRESLRLLRLILALIKLSIFQELAPVRGSELFGAAFIALAGELLRWLVILATCFTSDRHIVIVGCVVSIWVGREDFGRLRLLEASNNFPVPCWTLSGCPCAISYRTVWFHLVILRLVAAENS